MINVKYVVYTGDGERIDDFDFKDEAIEVAKEYLSKNPYVQAFEVSFGDDDQHEVLDTELVWTAEAEEEKTEEPVEEEVVFEKAKTRSCNLEDYDLDKMVEALNDFDEETVECALCKDEYPKDECAKEVDLGYICPRCKLALKSRGEEVAYLDEFYDGQGEAKAEDNYPEPDDAVVDCDAYTLVAHSEDEKPLDCKMEKEPLEKPLTEECKEEECEEEDFLAENYNSSIPVTPLPDSEIKAFLKSIPVVSSATPPKFFKVGYMSTVPVAAKYKDSVKVLKCSEFTVHTGNKYSSTSGAKAYDKAVADAGKEKQVKADTFTHSTDPDYLEKIGVSAKGNEQLQCYIKNGTKPLVQYYVSVDDSDLVPMTKADVAQYMTASFLAPKSVPETVSTIRRLNLSGIYMIGNLGKSALKEELVEDTHAQFAKPEGDRVRAYNNALTYAKKYNKPFIYGYTASPKEATKFFALDQPIKCSEDPVTDEKKFRSQYKNCDVVYVAYPDKEFIHEAIDSVITMTKDLLVKLLEATFNAYVSFNGLSELIIRYKDANGVSRGIAFANAKKLKQILTTNGVTYEDKINSDKAGIVARLTGYFDNRGKFVSDLEESLTPDEFDELEQKEKDFMQDLRDEFIPKGITEDDFDETTYNLEYITRGCSTEEKDQIAENDLYRPDCKDVYEAIQYINDSDTTLENKIAKCEEFGWEYDTKYIEDGYFYFKPIDPKTGELSEYNEEVELYESKEDLDWPEWKEEE